MLQRYPELRPQKQSQVLQFAEHPQWELRVSCIVQNQTLLLHLTWALP